MKDETIYHELVEGLTPYGQTHLLRHWRQLTPDEQNTLKEQIQSLDFDLVTRLNSARQAQADTTVTEQDVAGPSAYHLNNDSGKVRLELAQAVGDAALRAGVAGVIIVAGGQGTRLGFPHPKGMYPIGPVSRAPLFQILIEKVVALSRIYNVRIPVLLMTSPATHEETLTFFSDTNRFGLPPEDLIVFRQGVMPAVDAETGKVLLAKNGELSLSPDGHGGLLEALQKQGALEQMRAAGIEHFFYMQVDNPLVPVLHPAFLGYHILSNSEMSTLVTRKVAATDRLGNIVQNGDQLRVIEYSDLPEELADKRHEDGSLVLWAGSLGVHLFATSFLEESAEQELHLPYHYALKKVPYIEDRGKLIEPLSPNAVKFERFIFDLLPLARRAIVVEVDPQQAFAPLKNPPGAATDSPESVENQMVSLFRKWLQDAGARVNPKAVVEISPLYAIDSDQLDGKISPGTQVSADTYFV